MWIWLFMDNRDEVKQDDQSPGNLDFLVFSKHCISILITYYKDSWGLDYFFFGRGYFCCMLVWTHFFLIILLQKFSSKILKVCQQLNTNDKLITLKLIYIVWIANSVVWSSILGNLASESLSGLLWIYLYKSFQWEKFEFVRDCTFLNVVSIHFKLG